MGFIKETSSTRWNNLNTMTWDTAVLSWNDKWTKGKFVDPNAYTSLPLLAVSKNYGTAISTTNWNSITDKWNELT